MTLYETLKLLHVLSAIVWVGGGVFMTILYRRAAKGDPAHLLGVVRDQAFLGERVIGPSSILALIFGIWMVIESPAVNWSDTWIIIGLVGITISGVVGGTFYGTRFKALIPKLEKGENASALVRTIGLVSLIDLTIMFIVVWAMVTKPGV